MFFFSFSMFVLLLSLDAPPPCLFGLFGLDWLFGLFSLDFLFGLFGLDCLFGLSVWIVLFRFFVSFW